jgi:hypothetical protein
MEPPYSNSMKSSGTLMKLQQNIESVHMGKLVYL